MKYEIVLEQQLDTVSYLEEQKISAGLHLEIKNRTSCTQKKSNNDELNWTQKNNEELNWTQKNNDALNYTQKNNESKSPSTQN